MPAKRPTAVYVLAITSFIYGSLLLLCGVCGGGAILAAPAIQNMSQAGMKGPEAEKQRALQEKMERIQEQHNPHGYLIAGVQAGMQLVLGTMLFVGAVGLLKMKPSGRTLHLVYAILALAINIAMMAYTLIVTLPANDAMMKEMLENMTKEEQAMMKAFTPFMSLGGVIGVAGTLFWLIHPVATLIILLLPANAIGFRSDAERAEYRDGGAYSDDEPPPWRPGD